MVNNIHDLERSRNILDRDDEVWTPGVFNVTHQLNQNFVPIEYPRGFEPNINLEREGDGVDQTSREENDLNLSVVNSDLGAVGGASLSNINNNNGPPLMGSDQLIKCSH